MLDLTGAARRRQYCGRCNKLMFEFFVSPDGHFGLVSDISRQGTRNPNEINCPVCGAGYELLAKVDGAGQPVVRKFRGA
jgi:ribosomal protein S27AE